MTWLTGRVYISNLVVSDPDGGGILCEEPGENHHESDDDEGVEESVPGGQLDHGWVYQVSSVTNITSCLNFCE